MSENWRLLMTCPNNVFHLLLDSTHLSRYKKSLPRNQYIATPFRSERFSFALVQVHITQGDGVGRSMIISWVTPLHHTPNAVTYWEADAAAGRRHTHAQTPGSCCNDDVSIRQLHFWLPSPRHYSKA